MIYQGLFNIIDLYLKESKVLYGNLDEHFRSEITHFFKLDGKTLKEMREEIINFLIDELTSFGFDRSYVELKFDDPYIEFREKEMETISSSLQLYDMKIAPLVYELFLEKIVDYLVNGEIAPLMLNLKSNGIIPLEFIMELRNLKNLLENNPEKRENLRRYIHIKERVIQKFRGSRCDIENLETLKDPQDRLQLTYLVYRIIDFFHLEKMFDFTSIKQYLKNNKEEWLIDIPLVTLKNPDIYFCGIYLAKHLEVKIDDERVKEFLFNLLEEAVSEFESPLIEATDGLYYFLKSIDLMDLKLSDSQMDSLILTDSKYFQPNQLKNLETSQLVVILKILKMYGYLKKFGQEKVKAILNEIDYRITKEGITQFREGFISSEATYYVLFANYMRNTLSKLKNYPLLEQVVSRIYRNLEILDFCRETNNDLVSELFYSCESLKLFNCIETKEMIIHLARYLFPKNVVEKIQESHVIAHGNAKFRHLKVNKITGETIY
ncbi:MAG: hypothetical protein BAJALOKI2v1_120051 [Promethearchaeota archaeon]|nr:MAG: hypothetical protein BAJALOKI2v1_120051 [Candidatus Lokiarchaeota archaeon]